MKKHVRIIKITDGTKVWLSEEVFLPLERTNLFNPSFKLTRHTFYWKVELFIPKIKPGSLQVRVVDYNPENIASFQNQEVKWTPQKIYFEDMIRKYFEKRLTSYNATISNFQFADSDEFLDEKYDYFDSVFHIDDSNTELFDQSEIDVSQFSIQPDSSDDLVERIQEPIPEEKEQVHNVSFEFKLLDLEFIDGGVQLYKHFNFIDGTIKLQIDNEYIISPFNYIKPYFQKIIDKTYIQVNSKIIVKGNQVISSISTSNEIDLITSELIENVKIRRTNDLIRLTKESDDSEKNILSSEELLSKLQSEDKVGNIFDQNEIDLIKILVETQDIRNKAQLEYLSGTKQDKDDKIRFTLFPNFGFLFSIAGIKQYHFCWELLDSHATYVWSFDEEIQNQKRIESMEINMGKVIALKRQRYKGHVKKEGLPAGEFFKTINHVQRNKDDKLNFERWKAELSRVLV